ncbi:MAG TPA: GyrI-like domain-containing protein [Chitinophagaceae bacterium]|nr:GyrI-like domain-containing protein [Chitinophagaceae bacterium]
MKKWLSVLVIIFLLALAGIYIFIPPTITVTRYVKLRATSGGTERFIAQKNKWNSWWPGKKAIHTDTAFMYQGYTFHPGMALPGSAAIDITKNQDTHSSLLSILPLSRDSVGITWQCNVTTSSNPFQRLQRLSQSKQIDAAMSGLLDSMRAFFEKQENIYTVGITQTMVTDTLLVTTRKTFSAYPSTQAVYQLVGQLRNYIARQNAEAVNPPMLYVEPGPGGSFQTQVAIPVNKPLQGTANIQFKRMVPGKILVAEVTGGPHAIRHAFDQMLFYAEDYKKISPAIPFEMMVTDRVQETDTSRWITRIYYPTL